MVARMKWWGMMGYLFRRRLWVGLGWGIGVMRREGEGLANGLVGFGLGLVRLVVVVVLSKGGVGWGSVAVGFLSRAGQ